MNFTAIALFLDIYEFKFNLITTEIKQLSFPHPTMNPIQTFQGVILIDFSIWTSFVGQKWLVFNTYAYKHLMQSLYQNNKWHSIIPTRIPIKQIRVFVINMISRDDANIFRCTSNFRLLVYYKNFHHFRICEKSANYQSNCRYFVCNVDYIDL